MPALIDDAISNCFRLQAKIFTLKSNDFAFRQRSACKPKIVKAVFVP